MHNIDADCTMSRSDYMKRLSVMAVRISIVSCVTLATAVSSGCAGAGEGAVRGAASGALAGAASGLVTSLIWGGDPADHMARGMTAGATVGAIGGAVDGSARAKRSRDNEAARRQSEIEQFRRDIGDDAFNAVEALAECKFEVAVANANVASQSRNSNHALAGLWIKALTYADQGNETATRNLYPEIIRWDRDIDSNDDAEQALRDALRELKSIRSEFHLPPSCAE